MADREAAVDSKPVGRDDRRQGDGASGEGNRKSTANTASASDPSRSEAKGAKEKTPLQAVLLQSCVKAGGQQTLALKTLPKSAATYDSYYADGKSGMSEGFYGGNFGGNVPEDGTWSDSWIISPTAPPGRVRVIVQALQHGYEAASLDLYFDLVAPAGTCE